MKKIIDNIFHQKVMSNIRNLIRSNSTSNLLKWSPFLLEITSKDKIKFP